MMYYFRIGPPSDRQNDPFSEVEAGISYKYITTRRLIMDKKGRQLSHLHDRGHAEVSEETRGCGTSSVSDFFAGEWRHMTGRELFAATAV